MVCAQNLINSGNDGETENHIDDGVRPAVTTNDRQNQSTIYELLLAAEVTLCTLVLVSFSSAWSFPRNHSRKFTLSNDERRLLMTTKQATRPKSGLTMTVNTGRLGKAINNLTIHASTLDHERQEYVSSIIVATLHEEIFQPKVLHVNRTRLTKLTVQKFYRPFGQS